MSGKEDFSIENVYKKCFDEDNSSANATLKTLDQFLRQDKSNTLQELSRNIRETVDCLKNIDMKTEVESVAEIFLRFVTLNIDQHEFSEFGVIKEKMLKRSKLYMSKVANSRSELAKVGHKFIVDDSRILVHSNSRAVLQTLREAANAGTRFEVFVTESSPDYNGRTMFAALQNHNIKVTLILDSTIAYIMTQIDFVMVGAEGVCESGGIINKIGTYMLAICAKVHNKPFYVLAESYKFIRLYPLSQADIPKRLKWRLPQATPVEEQAHPLVDYTPPNYITLLFTDLGVLTTAAVCDTLLTLYT